jgi:hypothetical protein
MSVDHTGVANPRKALKTRGGHAGINVWGGKLCSPKVPARTSLLCEPQSQHLKTLIKGTVVHEQPMTVRGKSKI